MNIKTSVHPIYVNRDLIENPELYSSGFDKFLNADAEPNKIDSLLQTGTQIMNAFGIQSNRPLSDVENSCGKKPSFLRSHYEKNQWQKCANKYASAGQTKQTQQPATTDNTQQVISDSPIKKGLSKNQKIYIGVGIAAALGVAIWYFKFKKKK